LFQTLHSSFLTSYQLITMASLVIDVTDPESPAYCFVSIHGLECEDQSNIPRMVPLSATQYFRAYYPEPSSPTSVSDETNESNDRDEQRQKQSVLAILRPFESVPMITIDMLVEAWPGEYSRDEPNPSGLSLEPKEPSATSVHILPSLVDLTFVPALNHALQTGETDQLDPLMWLPENLSKIKETLRAHNPLSPIGLALLSKIISDEVKKTKSIDLSYFCLTREQVIKLLSIQEGVEALDLSHMQQITTDILRKLISILPNLRRLVLLHTIPDADVLTLLSASPESFYRIDSFIHLAFLRRFRQAAFPAVFSQIVTTQYQYEVSVASLPYFTVDQLVQGLTDYLSLLVAGGGSCETPLLSVYASAVRGPGRSWSERIVPFIPQGMSEKLPSEGWFLAWSVPSRYSKLLPYRYAFAKINKEVEEECQRRIEELRSSHSRDDKPQRPEGQIAAKPDTELEDSSGAKASLVDQELRAKEIAIKSEYADRRFHIFDVESFFQELVKEGRPAPSPEALTKLLRIFAMSKGISDRPQQIHLMRPADLTSYLKKTHKLHAVEFSSSHRFFCWSLARPRIFCSLRAVAKICSKL
jgi:hypothetical protein